MLDVSTTYMMGNRPPDPTLTRLSPHIPLIPHDPLAREEISVLVMERPHAVMFRLTADVLDGHFDL